MKRYTALFVGLGAALAFAGSAAAPAHAADKPQVTVTIRNFLYDPNPLQIATGTIVTWVNEDIPRHSATDDYGAFDTGLFGKGESRSIEFDYPGTYTYYCSIHPFMRGEIDVTPAAGVTRQTPVKQMPE
jgi:plastocyanin